MKIVVIGATGFIGRPLCNELAKTHEVTAMTRRPEKAKHLFSPGIDIQGWNPKALDGWETRLEGCDAIVNLTGKTVASARWTKNAKAEILQSRTGSLQILSEAVRRMQRRPKAIIIASATGFYGDRADDRLDETCTGGDDFLADVTRHVETISKEYEALGLRRVVVRTGIVLGASGGALPKIAAPFKVCLGGHFGDGTQWMSWISLADEVSALRFLIEHTELSGVFNLVSPEPVSNREFCNILARELKKPCWFHIPAIVLKTIFGQMANELFLASQRVYPENLLAAGFRFKHPTLKDALESILHSTQ